MFRDDISQNTTSAQPVFFRIPSKKPQLCLSHTINGTGILTYMTNEWLIFLVNLAKYTICIQWILWDEILNPSNFTQLTCLFQHPPIGDV